MIILKINSDSISRMVSGISKALSREGYQILLACTENQEEEELRFLTLFRENHVDGIILLGTIFTAEHRKALRNLSVPIVILSQYLKGYSCVYHNDYQAARNLAEYLTKTGRRFGYLGVTRRDEAVEGNVCGGAGRSSGRRRIPSGRKYPGMSVSDGIWLLQAQELLQRAPDLDTVICATDTIAVGALQYIKSVGKKCRMIYRSQGSGTVLCPA